MRLNTGALASVHGRLGAPLFTQKIQTFLQIRFQFQHAGDSEQQRAVELLARFVAVGFVCRQELAMSEILEKTGAMLNTGQ